MKSKLHLLIVGAAVLHLLTACGYIKSLFPDKEKDYQYTTEIPALILPPDLDKTGLPPIPSQGNADAIQTQNLENPSIETPAVTTTPITEPAIVDTSIDGETTAPAADAQASLAKHEAIAVELLKLADGSRHLRLSAPFDAAWRAVDKALSRKAIEVTSRNKSDKLFKLHYSPSEKKLEDGSLWDEARFIFGGFQSDEKEFSVKLIEKAQQTDVVVLDKEQKPATDTNAIGLLELLQTTLNADLAK
jgi:outer membrane protein assembly factor BamC